LVLFLKFTARVLVGTVGTVLFSVTEKTALNASAISASEESVLAKGLVGVEQRLDLPLLALELAVFDCGLPVAGLLLDVEVQTGGATDGLQALNRIESSN
jgi:hypothetical protein